MREAKEIFRLPESTRNFGMATSTHTDLQITGMHCASCSARLEKVLDQLPEVTATVNIATGKAHVTPA